MNVRRDGNRFAFKRLGENKERSKKGATYLFVSFQPFFASFSSVFILVF